MTETRLRFLVLAACLALGGCASLAARDCLGQAMRADPDEQPTTQGHDHAQALMGACMEKRGFAFDWNDRPCDLHYPATIDKGRCYRRDTPSGETR